jgi:hypothetical protein
VTASGFTKDDGKTVKVAAVDVNAGTTKATAMGTIASGGATFTLDVDPNTMYRVNLFADSDGNGACEFGVDDAVSVVVNDIAEGKSAALSLSPSQADSHGCLSFGGGTLKVTGTGFTANKVFFAQILKKDGSNYKKLGNPLNGPVSSSGAIDIEFPGGIVTQTFYRVDFYIDDNPTNGKCDTTDKVFRVDSGALAPNQTPAELDYTVNGTDTPNTAACASFQ